MKKKFLFLNNIFLLILLSLLIGTNNQTIKAEQTKNIVNIYFFHSNTCSHCKSETELLDQLEERYDNIKIYRYEIHEENNNEVRKTVQELFDITTNGVPLTIIGATPYSGYNEAKSTTTFIKTIEYYSKYGYIDKVGELLKVESLPYYKINENTPTLEDFIETYGNYKLIGNLSTNDFDLSTNTSLIAALSQLNIYRILSLIIVFILLSKIPDTKTKLLLLIDYLIISFGCTTISLINHDIYTLAVQIILLTLLLISSLCYYKNRKRKYLYGNIFMVIAIISNQLEHLFTTNNSIILKELLSLNNIVELAQTIYYIHYLFIIIISNIFLVLILYGFKKIIQTK